MEERFHKTIGQLDSLQNMAIVSHLIQFSHTRKQTVNKGDQELFAEQKKDVLAKIVECKQITDTALQFKEKNDFLMYA